MYEWIKYLLHEKTKHFLAGVFIGFGPTANILFNNHLLTLGLWEWIGKALGSVLLLGVSGLTTALFADIYKKKLGPWMWKVYHKRFPNNKKIKNANQKEEGDEKAA